MKRKILVLASTALLLPAPLAAQDDAMEMTEMSDGGDDDTETLGLLAYLGLSAAEGKTTIDEGAGKIEGQMLGAAMAWKAAEQIVDSQGVKGVNHVYLLPGSSKLNVEAFYVVKEQLSYLNDEFTSFQISANQAGCGNGVPKPRSDDGKDDAVEDKPKAFEFKASDLVGLLKTDTSLSAVEVTVSENVMTNALLAHAGSSAWKLTEEIAFPSDDDTLSRDALLLKDKLKPFMVGMCGKDAKVKAEDKKKIIAEATKIFGKVADLSKSEGGKYSPLMQARLASSIASSGQKDVRTLRYEVSAAGGTLVNSSNIWTSIGIPGVTMRGGLVVTYRLSNPKNGTTQAQGVIICRAPMKSLKSITAKHFDAKDIDCTAQKKQVRRSSQKSKMAVSYAHL